MDFPTFRREVERLASKINAQTNKFDLLIGIARGGWIPARLLSDELGVKYIASFGIRYADTSRLKLEPYSEPYPRPEKCRLLLVSTLPQKLMKNRILISNMCTIFLNSLGNSYVCPSGY